MPASPTVLHYVGYDDDRGGIVSVVRVLAGVERFGCVLGVNSGCVQSCQPALPVLELPRLEGEKISLANLARARSVALVVQRWLGGDATRIFHGHSRAGLLVALWLVRWGERRVVVSVHCYGKRRWFYRWAERQLGERMFWLTPSMHSYYGVAGEGWAQCIPGAVAEVVDLPSPKATDGVVRLAGIGALVRWKGWHNVIAALAELPPEILGRLRFSHIGTDDGSTGSLSYAKELQTLTGHVRLRDTVRWLGQQPSSSPLLAESTALVVASENEPFSIGMLEALRFGLPVIAADSGGAKDLIVPPANGLLFKSGSASDLACLMRLLVEEDALAKVRIDREALRRFSAPVVAAQWAEIYARVLALH